MNFSTFGQRYADKEYVSVNGDPLNIEYSTSMLTSNGHHMTIGNTQTPGEGANVYLVKKEPDGTVIWEKEYDGPDHMNDHGVAIAEDGNGNYLVAGSSYRTSSGSYDVLVLKFNSSGQLLWEYSYNGTANGDDVPCGIAVDGSEVVVAAGVENSSTMTDIAAIRLEPNGTHMWTQTYDHNQLEDAPGEVKVDPSSGTITVMGGSAEQANLYDMVTLEYDATGNLLQEHRSDYNVGVDRPTGFDADSAGNKVVAGYYIPNSGDTEMSLFSLDDTLGLNWSITPNPTTGDDKFTDVAVTEAGEAYAVGHIEARPDYFKSYVARFDSSGNLVWEKKYQNPDGGAMGRKIRIDDDGDLNIAGIDWTNSDTNLLTLQYDENGRLLLSEVHEASGTEIAKAIETDLSGNIYVQGTSSNNGDAYTTVKYNTFERDKNVVNDTASGGKYVGDELIVQFQPEATLKWPFDTKNKSFGKLEEFLSRKALNSLDEHFEYSFRDFDAVKVFQRMTRADSLSVSRLGDTVELHHFWSTLVVMLPASMDESATAGILNDSSLNDVVYHAELNLVGEAYDIPNDPGFDQQVGFESDNFPQNDINMDRAWDIYPGSNNAKVGVYDSGLDWAHEDFSTTGSGTFNDSKVIGGWDFINNNHISNTTYGTGHGTKCAGIIGAIRDNDIGVAGVAGGEGDNNNSGAQLFGFKILEGGSFPSQTSIDNAASAMIEGAVDYSDYGYGLHVLSSSWGIPEFHPQYSISNEALFVKTNKTIYDHGAVSVVARGNSGNTNESIPATISYEHFLISVGANGGSGDRVGWSSFGQNVDIIAPGIPELLHTAHRNDQYGDFQGTSAATPHVAGVAALLIGNANDPAHWSLPNSLGPDDVENLIQIYGSDEGPTGYDPQNGWGRLNAGLVMEHMEWPYYWVEHFEGSTSSYTSTQVANNQVLHLGESINGLPAPENYIGDIYEIEITVNHSIGSANLLNSWIRNRAPISNMLDGDIAISDVPNAELVSANANQAVIRGHIFKLETTQGGQPVNEWVPFQDGDPADYAYSLHLHDWNASSTEEHEEAFSAFSVHPNPAEEQHTLTLPEGKNMRVELIDLQGRRLKQVFQGSLERERSKQIELDGLAPGMYYYRLQGGDEKQVRTLKFIKR